MRRSNFLFLLGLAVFPVWVAVGCSNTSCRQRVDSALVNARRDRKRLLIKFGSSWCKGCRDLEALLKSPPIWSILGRHYDLLVIHYNEDSAHQALEVPGTEDWLKDSGVLPSLPAMAVLDETGAVVASSSKQSNILDSPILGGPPYSYTEIPSVLRFFKSGSPDIADAELWKLRRILESQIPKR